MAEHLNHLDERGGARMVDISAKSPSGREATASAFVRVGRETLELVRRGALEKGDILAVARIAGIMAAKRTAELIPLCHPLPIEQVAVGLGLVEDGITIEATVKTYAKTGVEMEALTAASVAALTVYDMCKSADRGIVIERIRLERKSGGRGGEFVRGDV